MSDSEKIVELKKLMKTISNQIKEIYDDSEGIESPVDIDLIKTVKAMFYEDARKILKKKTEEV